MNRKQKNKMESADIADKRFARWLKSRSMTVIVGVISTYFFVLSIFLFRNIPYLSDGTFLLTEWPFLFFSIVVILLLINFFLFSKKKTKTRKIMKLFSVLAVISLVVNSIVNVALTKPKQAALSNSESINAGAAANLKLDGETFMAGAAKGDITPSQNLMPMPLLSVLKFREILDPVYARVLAMSDGNQQYLFIMLDMTLVPEAEKTLDFISEQTAIPRNNIFIAATHTHGVTPVSLMDYKNPIDKRKSEKWYEEIKKTLLSTIVEAQSKMVPAKYGYGEGQSNININRDMVVGENKSVLGVNHDRPSDKTIRMVRIENMNGKVIALIVNHATHAVVMNGAISGLGTGWTGDLAGKTSTKIEAQLDDAVVLWSAGAAGDQNPRISAQYASKVENGKPVKKNLGKVAYTLLDYLSDEHVRDIMKANKAIEATETDPQMYTAEKTALVDSIDEGEKQAYTLRLFVIGDIAFQGISAEIVTSIGEAVREVSPFKDTILVTLANGYEGYVADDWEFDHDAFEVGLTKAKKGAAQIEFIKGFKELFNDMPR